MEKTPEGEAMDELDLTRICCRRHFLSHVDIYTG
jgi:DNA-directed RNA polymerase I, II, and III subunit RPABC5